MKKVLVIIDPQNDFITGSMAVPYAECAVQGIGLHLLAHHDDYEHIIISQDWHPENHCSFQEQGGEWPSHCVADSWGAELPPYLETIVQDLKSVIWAKKGQKQDVDSYSIEGSEEWANIAVILSSADQIDVVGIAGDYCVYESVLSMAKINLESKIVLLTDYIVSIDGGKKLKELMNSMYLYYV